MAATSVTGVGTGSSISNQPARKAFQYQIVAAGEAVIGESGDVDVDVEDWKIDVNSGAFRVFCTPKSDNLVSYGDYSFGTRSGLSTSFIGLVTFNGPADTAFDWMIVQTKAK